MSANRYRGYYDDEDDIRKRNNIEQLHNDILEYLQTLFKPLDEKVFGGGEISNDKNLREEWNDLLNSIVYHKMQFQDSLKYGCSPVRNIYYIMEQDFDADEFKEYKPHKKYVADEEYTYTVICQLPSKYFGHNSLLYAAINQKSNGIQHIYGRHYFDFVYSADNWCTNIVKTLQDNLIEENYGGQEDDPRGNRHVWYSSSFEDRSCRDLITILVPWGKNFKLITAFKRAPTCNCALINACKNYFCT